ncbi:hypothetical protein [Leucobacter chinensis]|uniref:hypothetical protein n=1 Tax=Leucobacter chinensis TaxID=2851010 RepID=UPI001C21910C|nr:hypothetical protein [Leucobacter chinensis]
MFGRRKPKPQPQAAPAQASAAQAPAAQAPAAQRGAAQSAPAQPGDSTSPVRRHGRRPIRSSLAGTRVRDPHSRVETFKHWAAATIQYLRQQLPDDLDDVNIGFMSLPPYEMPEGTHSEEPMFWLVSPREHMIYLFRAPIQRFRGLHEPDEVHRRMFVEWCVYQAVCEYLGEDPWTLLPGRFEHY